MGDDLDRLIAQGRALREREKAAQEPDDAIRRREDRLARKHRHASLSHYAGWGWIVASIAAGISVATSLYPLLPPSWSSEGDGGDPATLVLLLAGALPALPLWLLRPLFGGRAVAEEEARLRALGFPVTGYLEALGQDPRDWTVRLAIRFRGARPERQLLEDAFRTIGAEIELAGDTTRATASCAFSFESSQTNNGYVARFVRRALGVVAALHGRHPVEEVHVTAT